MKTYTVEIDNKGTKRWYINGKLHRKDGPAVEYEDGYKAWWINGERVTEQDVLTLKKVA